MQVRVLFFGMLRDLAGRADESITLPEDATLNDVLSHFTERIPGLGAMIPSLAMSINQEYAAPESRLSPGDEIAILPPVSGGSKDRSRHHVSLTREAISAQAVADKIKQPADGAVVLFDGVVRNHTRGRQTQFLQYEAYEEMAVKQMNALATQAQERFPVREVAIVHRLGRLEIGETSVVIAVASAHRAAAFEACRWLIDTLKCTVPIWKKEHFADGAVWADGEAFPPGVAQARSSHDGKLASK